MEEGHAYFGSISLHKKGLQCAKATQREEISRERKGRRCNSGGRGGVGAKKTGAYRWGIFKYILLTV
jgi:hypothetical protein